MSIAPTIRPPVALTIAGSDSGGGAGVQADLKTFARFGVFGTSAITAVTAQDTRRVAAVHALSPRIVRQQIDAVATDLAPAAVKSGMLPDSDTVECVAQAIRRHRLRPFVLDPVQVATSGDRLAVSGTHAAVLANLVPLATLVTPNLEEAAVLTGAKVESPREMQVAARALVRMGARSALIKGGHLPSERGAETGPGSVCDILFDGERTLVWRHPRLDGGPFHGTGCTLAAAVTAGLALGEPLVRAVGNTIGYVRGAIASSTAMGSGAVPPNHGAPVTWLAPVEWTG